MTIKIIKQMGMIKKKIKHVYLQYDSQAFS